MNTEETEKPTVKPIKILNELRVQIEPPASLLRWVHEERHEATLKTWAREFEEFIRDHRSQDPVSLTVIRDEFDGCSHCGAEWETQLDDDGDTACSSCGRVHQYATPHPQP